MNYTDRLLALNLERSKITIDTYQVAALDHGKLLEIDAHGPLRLGDRAVGFEVYVRTRRALGVQVDLNNFLNLAADTVVPLQPESITYFRRASANTWFAQQVRDVVPS